MGEPLIKSCACGATYTQAQLDALHYVGQSLDGGEPYELRVCASCRSAIAIGIKKPKIRRAAKK